MDKQDFIKRLVALRMNKGVSARDMSLSLGQSPSYITNIENGINLPSMTVFFFICEYFGITPQEFFETESANPKRLQELIQAEKHLTTEQIDIILALIKQFK